MPASRFQPDAVYDPAPAGTRVRLTTTALGLIAAMAVVVVLTVMLRETRPPPWPALCAPPAILVALAVNWHGARVRRYRLTADDLRVERAFHTPRFPLAGLQSASVDPEALRGARKVIGNDGLGAVAGRFRSKRLGSFRVYLTDGEHAVVLRWPDRCVVISPQQHALFVADVRKRAGLAG